MLPGVATLRDPLPLGKKTSEAFEKVFGITTVGDLLRHYPRRYYTRGELTSLAELREGDHVTVLARVESAVLASYSRNRFPNGGRKTTDRAEVSVTDGTASLTLTFFGGAHRHVGQLKRGKVGLFAGTVSTFRGHRQLVHPEYELLPADVVDAESTA